MQLFLSFFLQNTFLKLDEFFFPTSSSVVILCHRAACRLHFAELPHILVDLNWAFTPQDVGDITIVPGVRMILRGLILQL
jgi:hypothetical protein